MNQPENEPECPRIMYLLSTWRPSSDKKAPDLKVKASEERWIFTDKKRGGLMSSRAKAKRRIEETRKKLPPGWELKVTVEEFSVTHGAPGFVPVPCPNASCSKFGKPAGLFYCGTCREPLSPKMAQNEMEEEG
ncbi:MAG: hypothetical protein WC348_00830 [Patescibacteria group bacterium]|jgi:hypothetical protein